MNISPYLKFTPWDSIIFGIDTFEVIHMSPEALDAALANAGHYTAKVDPLLSKKLLHEKGFYYCDTLIEPYCTPETFNSYDNRDVGLDHRPLLENLLASCHQTFVHGRFHRDFNVTKEIAEQRYINWIRQLHESNKVYELTYKKERSGFIALDNNKLVLHALNSEFRGRGLAKYFWSAMCNELFNRGTTEITSSISASNVPVLNLYASLGFRFRNPYDVYHRLVP